MPDSMPGDSLPLLPSSLRNSTPVNRRCQKTKEAPLRLTQLAHGGGCKIAPGVLEQIAFNLGVTGDIPITGDWNGDRIDTVGVFRPSNGALYLKNSSQRVCRHHLTYGLPGDKPVTGDWDGNGTDTIGIYRNGVFHLRNSNTNGFADLSFGLGVNGDVPIAGDWNGLP